MFMLFVYCVGLCIKKLLSWNFNTNMNWIPKRPEWWSDDFNLLSTGKPPNECTVQEIIRKSENFPIKFPVDTGRLKTLQHKKNVTEEFLKRNINSVYPFIHESILKLYLKFINFKRINGSLIEKEFYKNMDLKTFADRLLRKRAVMFMGKYDQYILLTGEKGSKNWETIGTDQEKPPLIIKNCLSYDEIKLSAFLYVSSYTYFVNLGDRKNKAVYADDRSLIEEEGIIAGMIGPRLVKPGVMDFQEFVVTAEQNKKSNGYGIHSSIHKLFAEFYEEDNPLYETVIQRKSGEPNSSRYEDIKTPKGEIIFDNQMYQKRLTIVFDCLLLESNFRAKEAKKTAYIHVVGLGLGVWSISKHQENVFMECFYNRIIALLDKLSFVSDICFSYFHQKSCGVYKNGETIRGNDSSKGIKIHIFQREPHTKLEDKGKLLIVSYAWDGNALPGNEYWCGKLGSSGDSAAASSTQISELHNPHINPLVCADNLRIVTLDGEVMPLESYVDKVKSTYKKRPGSEEEIPTSTKKTKKS